MTTRVDVRNSFLINGAWQAPLGTGRQAVINPATEEEAGSVPLASAADIDDAARAASRAFPDWSATPLEQRLSVLARLRDELAARSAEIADTVTTEVGTPRAASEAAQALAAIGAIDSAIRTASAFTFEERTGALLTIRVPVGVVGVITPWNFPLTLALMKIAPALAAGCSVVFKPPEVTPLNAYILAEASIEAGLPPGVLNVLPGLGPEAGEAMICHPEISLISFTGSTGAGRRVHELAGGDMTRVNLELGGKSACIVLDDADLASAVQAAMSMLLFNAGQNCGAWSRMLVPRARLDEAVQMACDAATSVKVGDPFASDTDIGPVVSERQYLRVTEYIRRGEREGATIACGGAGRLPGLDRGYYVRPTVFTDVTNDMTIAQEEIFGPVVCIIAHDGDDDAVSIANDSRYGLHGGVMATDVGRAERVARRVRTGQMFINGLKRDDSAPFGGFKQSGIGRTGGLQGFETYFETKAILT